MYNVPIKVDTRRRRDPIKWTQEEGIESLKMDIRKRYRILKSGHKKKGILIY